MSENATGQLCPMKFGIVSSNNILPGKGAMGQALWQCETGKCQFYMPSSKCAVVVIAESLQGQLAPEGTAPQST